MGIQCFIILGLVTLVLSFPHRIKRETNCCPDGDCFTDEEPYDHLPVPECTDKYNVSYHLFTRTNPTNGELITREHIGRNFDGRRRTIIFIHGWHGVLGKDSTAAKIRNELLQQGEYNVIVVDWRDSADDPYYPQSAANTRSLGAKTAHILRSLVKKGGAKMSDMYCVGHSLGAHACGQTGKRVNGLGRITGMDPAAPLFENYPTENRVDKGDAILVDIIHTGSSGSLIVDLGIDKAIGHIDFYPNMGEIQPGCVDRSGTEKMEDPTGGCSHKRSAGLFIESINGKCPFTSVPCSSRDDAKNGACNVCTDSCQYMGFHADKYSGRGIFYLKTNEEPPYCIK